MGVKMKTVDRPLPSEDWIPQCEVASMLAISPQTASSLAKMGRLQRFEHGVPGCGRRRKYSRRLVERELERRWDAAVEAQDAILAQN
jgi:hypothetical protein